MPQDPSQKQEHAIKLTGKAFIPEALLIGERYHVAIDGTITERNESDNHNGTHLLTYKFEPVMVAVIDDKGKSIRGKDVRRKSQQLRAAIYREWESSGDNTEFEDYYNMRIDGYIKDIINTR